MFEMLIMFVTCMLFIYSKHDYIQLYLRTADLEDSALVIIWLLGRFLKTPFLYKLSGCLDNTGRIVQVDIPTSSNCLMILDVIMGSSKSTDMGPYEG